MTTNHPAHGPVSLDRLHQISEILSKASAQSDGGNLGYAMADAVKVIDLAIAAFGAEPVAIKCHVPHEAKGRIDPDEPNYSDGYRVGWNSCRAAMLQGAEPVTTDYKLPFEQWLSQQTGTIDVECGCVMTEVFFHWLRVAYEAGNYPVIPDGWVLVPVEPTEDMIVNGFESEPDESFSDEKEWKAYDAMSRCQQAAHRAKLCWAAMIEAAPKLE